MADNKEQTKLVTLYIDGKGYQVDPTENILANVLAQHLNLPYFCWHPSMGSVGACRQCAVTQFQDENDTRGRIIMSCMTPVTDGMRIGLADGQSKEFREQLIGAMMTNHPHDCPVCAEGGECHLQDMTVMTGHSARSYKGTKRTFSNQNLGQLVGHEMNRCITCYRCVRFYNDYAGGKDFGVYGSKNQVYFGRQQDGQLESEFSGNLVEVCPTGVFTNKLFSAHYTRKWDLQSAPSICSHCAVGCNLSIGERYGSVRRVMNRYHHDVNGYFICDRGRFGIGFVNDLGRITSVSGISQRSPEKLSELDVKKSFIHLKNQRLVAIGSARASLETNSYLKSLFGEQRFSLGYSETKMRLAAAHLALVAENDMVSLHQAEQSDFVLVLGEDITQSSPRVALSIRQALRNASFEKAASIGIPKWQDDAVRTCGGKTLSPMFSINSQPTKLDDVAKGSLVISPERILACIETLTEIIKCAEFDVHLSDVDIDNLALNSQQIGEVLSKSSDQEIQIIKDIVTGLVKSKSPLIASGWSLHSAEILMAITALLQSIRLKLPELNLQTIVAPDECNSLGVLALADQHSLSIEQVLDLLAQEQADGVVIVENALHQCTDEQITALRNYSNVMVVCDHSTSRLSSIADIVLPASPVSESAGHYINYQGLAQNFYPVHPSKLPVLQSWQWLNLYHQIISDKTNVELAAVSDLQAYIAGDESIALPSAIKQLFAKIEGANNYQGAEIRPLARAPHRASGRTAQMANISVHEAKSTQTKHASFAFSMEGRAPGHTAEMPFMWAPGWNSNQSITHFLDKPGGDYQNVKTSEHHQLAIDFSSLAAQIASLSDKWLSSNRQHIQAASLGYRVLVSNQANKFSLVISRPWYAAEWQAKLTAEFELLHQGDVLFVASEDLAALGLQTRQIVRLTILPETAADASEQITFARVQAAKTQAVGHLVLTTNNLDHLTNGFNTRNLLLNLATDEESASYQQAELARHKSAKQRKAEILEQLKQQDQYIPIRLVAGGLDDY